MDKSKKIDYHLCLDWIQACFRKDFNPHFKENRMSDTFIIHVGKDNDYAEDAYRTGRIINVAELIGRKIYDIYFDEKVCNLDEFILEVE